MDGDSGGGGGGSVGSSTWINEDDLMRYAAAAEYSDLRKPTSAAKDPLSPAPPRFIWSKNWYPLCVEAVTRKDELHAHNLLGRSIVLWWDPSGNGAWRCMTDACPHRLAPLSEGSITPTGGVRYALPTSSQPGISGSYCHISNPKPPIMQACMHPIAIGGITRETKCNKGSDPLLQYN